MKNAVVHILQELNRKGRTMILVTHDEEIAEHANVIYHIRDGNITTTEAST